MSHIFLTLAFLIPCIVSGQTSDFLNLNNSIKEDYIELFKKTTESDVNRQNRWDWRVYRFKESGDLLTLIEIKIKNNPVKLETWKDTVHEIAPRGIPITQSKQTEKSSIFPIVSRQIELNEKKALEYVFITHQDRNLMIRGYLWQAEGVIRIAQHKSINPITQEKVLGVVSRFLE